MVAEGCVFNTRRFINPLPYIVPYGEDFRAISLFKKPAKKPQAKRPVLKMSLRNGVQNEYSRVWPLLGEEEFCSERAKINKQRVHPKSEGFKASLARASRWEKGKIVNTPNASSLKRSQLVRGSPLETADRIKRIRISDEPIPVKKQKPPLTVVRRSTRQRRKPK